MTTTTSLLATVIFLTFAALATLGVYLVTAHFRTHRLAALLAFLTLLLFAALHLTLSHLVASYAQP